MASYQLDDEISGRPYDHKLMKRLMRYVAPHAALFGLALFLSVALTAITLSGPMIVSELVDLISHTQAAGPAAPSRPLTESQKLAADEAERGPRAITVGVAQSLGGVIEPVAGQPGRWTLIGTTLAQMLLAYAGLLLILQFLNFVGIYWQQLAINWLGQDVLHELRMGLFRHFQTLPISFFQKQPVGRLVTRLTNDINALSELFTGALIPIITNVFTVFGVAAVMLWTSLQLGLISLAAVPLIAVVTFVFQHFIRNFYRASRKAFSRINAYLAEQINGMREVQVFNRETHNLNEFKKINDGHFVQVHRSMVAHAIYRPVATILYSVSLALVIWIGGGDVVQKHITLGQLMLYIQLVQHFYGPIQNLAEQYNLILGAMASAERVFTMLDVENTLPDPAAPKDSVLAASGVKGHVKFTDVHFRYRPEESILRGINIEAAPGEHIAIVGHTGAGKSTCIGLLSRLYDVEAGAITLDGVDLRELSGAFIRRYIAVVHQDVFCFAGTLADNISLGAPTISHEQVERCAKAVNAHAFISRLPNGYATTVTEGGKTFSLGERQLLAFARALAYDPKILVLDEATANIDTQTESLIQAALQTLIRGRTAIIIAHRLSTIKMCDRIYVLEKGQVAEVGTHQQLLAQGGRYAELYQQQFAEQEANAVVATR